MGKKKVEFETKVATALGIYGGRRIHRGSTFTAPVEFEGGWFRPLHEGSVEAELAAAGEPDILDGSIAEAARAIQELDHASAASLLSREQSGQRRKGMMELLKARVDQLEEAGRESEEELLD